MTCQMAWGTKTTMSLSCLSSMYTRKDTLTDKKSSQETGNYKSTIYAWVVSNLKTYNAHIEVTNDLPLLCKIARVDPSVLLLKSAHELFCKADK